MKKIALIGFILFCQIIIYAQNNKLTTNNEILTTNNRIKVGTNLITNQDIIANQITFPCYIYSTCLDTLDQRLTLQLRYLKKKAKSTNNKSTINQSSVKNENEFKNKGFLAEYDLKNDKVLWAKATKTFDISQNYDILIKNEGKKSARINTETGNTEWQIDDKIVYFEPYMQIAFGNKKKMLNCYNLNDGSLMWYRKLKHKSNWENVIPVNDSSLVISSDGIHTINVNDGTGWDYKTNTKYTNAGWVLTADAAKVVGSLSVAILSLGEVVPIPSFRHIYRIKGIRSNILYDGTNYYFASKESLICINNNGQEMWENKLPKKSASKSALEINRNNIYLINYGYASDKHQPTIYGVPFIAAYNIQTGKQQFLNKIPAGNTISDFQFINGALQVIINNNINIYSLNDGILIGSSPVDGDFQGYADNTVYTRLPNSTYESIASTDTTKSYLSTAKGKFLTLDNNLNIVGQTDTSQTYSNYLTTKDYKFLAKNKETIMINNQGKEVASFKASDQSMLIGSKLYDTQDDKLIEIDLKGFINN